MPLPNVWLGVSTERQQEANERVPDLLATPAAERFVSAEPLLGHIDFRRMILVDHPAYFGVKAYLDALIGQLFDLGDSPIDDPAETTNKLGLIIVGGESGHDARPMHPDWPRSIRDQCATAGTAFFFKQWGGWKPISQMRDGECDGLYHPAPLRNPEAIRRCKVADAVLHRDGSRHDDPRDFQAFAAGSGAMTMFQVGKKRAGRLLDGREHNDMPGAPL